MTEQTPNRSLRFWQISTGVLAFCLLGVIIFGVGFSLGQGTKSAVESGEESATRETTGADLRTVLAEVIPTGVPAVYGAELDISYDDVTLGDPQSSNEAIEILSQLDRTLELSGDELERYVDILYHQHDGMSCEFCCGVRSIIFEDGRAACGCAHSFAMRGLAKYLISEHADELSDEEILSEIGKWKVLFFPEIHAQKATVMQESDLTIDYISLTSNTHRGLEEGATGGGMIGDC